MAFVEADTVAEGPDPAAGGVPLFDDEVVPSAVAADDRKPDTDVGTVAADGDVELLLHAWAENSAAIPRHAVANERPSRINRLRVVWNAGTMSDASVGRQTRSTERVAGVVIDPAHDTCPEA
jgi:hypothetical protein